MYQLTERGHGAMEGFVGSLSGTPSALLLGVTSFVASILYCFNGRDGGDIVLDVPSHLEERINMAKEILNKQRQIEDFSNASENDDEDLVDSIVDKKTNIVTQKLPEQLRKTLVMGKHSFTSSQGFHKDYSLDLFVDGGVNLSGCNLKIDWSINRDWIVDIFSLKRDQKENIRWSTSIIPDLEASSHTSKPFNLQGHIVIGDQMLFKILIPNIQSRYQLPHPSKQGYHQITPFPAPQVEISCPLLDGEALAETTTTIASNLIEVDEHSLSPLPATVPIPKRDPMIRYITMTTVFAFVSYILLLIGRIPK